MYTTRLTSLQKIQLRAPNVRSMQLRCRAFPANVNATTVQLTIKIGSDSDDLMQAARLRAEAYYEVRLSSFFFSQHLARSFNVLRFFTCLIFPQIILQLTNPS